MEKTKLNINEILKSKDDDIIIHTDHSEDDDIESEIEEMYHENIEVEELDKENQYELVHKFNTNKHRQEGKHSLPYDEILKGKKDILTDDPEYHINTNVDNGINVFEIKNTCDDDYLEERQINTEIYDTLKEKTDIDFSVNRRKPSRDIFNEYYNLLIKELNHKYSKSEIFVELAFYFSDNVFNMFKLLDKKPAMMIINELKEKGLLKNLKGVNFL